MFDLAAKKSEQKIHTHDSLEKAVVSIEDLQSETGPDATVKIFGFFYAVNGGLYIQMIG